MSLDRAAIITLGSKLAPAAATFGQLRGLLNDPNTGSEEIVQLIRLDPALTFHVIRMSNSVIFGLRDQNDSLEGAVGRVGFREIYRLVGLAAAQQVCQNDLPNYRLKATRLWENSIATAASAEVLAGKAGADTGLAYTSGLLRTLGRVIIDGFAVGRVYPGGRNGRWSQNGSKQPSALPRQRFPQSCLNTGGSLPRSSTPCAGISTRLAARIATWERVS
jgi:hypothetical protein